MRAALRGRRPDAAGAPGSSSAGRTPGQARPVASHLGEREILDLLAQGCDNVTIGRRLVVSDKTVRNHVSTVLTKLQVASRAEAVALARDAGIGPSGG